MGKLAIIPKKARRKRLRKKLAKRGGFRSYAMRRSFGAHFEWGMRFHATTWLQDLFYARTMGEDVGDGHERGGTGGRGGEG